MSGWVEDATWPSERLGEALAALAEESGLAPHPAEMPRTPDAGDLDTWIAASAAYLGVEVEPVETAYADVMGLIAGGAPALLRFVDGGATRLLALVGGGRRRARLLVPDRSVRTVPSRDIAAALRAAAEGPRAAAIDRLLEDTGVPPRRRARVREALLGEQLAGRRIDAGWLLRPPPDAPITVEARREGVGRRLGLLAAAHTAHYLLWLVAWWMIGKGALSGHFDRGWLAAWLLLLLTMAPLRSAASWIGGGSSLDLAGILKRRLLVGALQIEPEELRHQGAGQLLGRVLESQAIESLAIDGGLAGITSLLELVLAAVVLALGAGGLVHTLLLIGWVAVTALVARRYHRLRDRWTAGRIAMTNDLVERMVGHRTRLAQEASERWHDGEDQVVADYVERSRDVDGTATVLGATSRAWLLVGVAALVPAFVAGGAPVALAIGLGGVLLAAGALARLGTSLTQLSGAWIAWRRVAPLYHAARGRPSVAAPSPAVVVAKPIAAGQRLVEAQELSFRYRDRGPLVVERATLEVRAGERVLLEGPSGGGKSTLASLLVGLRRPESGLLLLDGLDRPTLGADGWRRRVVCAPQFHENHVLAGTFAFNLLLGRRWPPLSRDLEAAEAVCSELGLGDLIARMPSGLQQQLGDTGWQLSHGERSRLYIARALLQEAELVVLDESFAALDPETLRRALECVLRRAKTLLVIAHP